MSTIFFALVFPAFALVEVLVWGVESCGWSWLVALRGLPRVCASVLSPWFRSLARSSPAYHRVREAYSPPGFPELRLPRLSFRLPPLPAPGWFAPSGVRHPRDFVGPSLLLSDEHNQALLVVASWFTACFVVAVLWVLWDQYVNDPEAPRGLWLDTPAVLPEAVGIPEPDLETSSFTSPKWRFIRSCGGHVPITSALSCERLRPRARWVRALEATLGGRRGVVASFVRGRWVPDLPSAERDDLHNYCLGSIRNGVRCLGGGIAYGDKQLTEGRVYLILDNATSVEVVFPDLLGQLRLYSVFRKRDEQLLGSLRSRALEWCRVHGLSPVVSDLAVTGTVSYAMEPSTHELPAAARVAQAIRTSPCSGGLA